MTEVVLKSELIDQFYLTIGEVNDILDGTSEEFKLSSYEEVGEEENGAQTLRLVMHRTNSKVLFETRYQWYKNKRVVSFCMTGEQGIMFVPCPGQKFEVIDDEL